MLEAKNVSVSAGGQLLLDSVSAQMDVGKVSVILGPNGAGKSTLLSCLAGLCVPDNGSVAVGGEIVTAMDSKHRARHIGLLPQSANVHWDLEVRDLVALGRYPFHGQCSKAEDDTVIDAAMQSAAITEFSGRNVLSLSGGERARVLLARVLAGQPEWLLADEPLANLDPRYQLQLLKQMRVLANDGVGVVAVLHDLTHAARIADHVILLSKGRVFAAGSPEKVLTPDNLKAVYHIESAVLFDDDGQIVIVPKD